MLSRFQSHKIFHRNTFAVPRSGVLYAYLDNYDNYRGVYLMKKSFAVFLITMKTTITYLRYINRPTHE